MKATYDPEVDILNIVLKDALIEESDESKPGVILDFDKDGNVVGIEILNVSKRTENPRSFEYAVTAWPSAANALLVWHAVRDNKDIAIINSSGSPTVAGMTFRWMNFRKALRLPWYRNAFRHDGFRIEIGAAIPLNGVERDMNAIEILSTDYLPGIQKRCRRAMFIA
jgi:uncharacterized protein YuzE